MKIFCTTQLVKFCEEKGVFHVGATREGVWNLVLVGCLLCMIARLEDVKEQARNRHAL
jgi:hypothetical protein